MNEQELFLDGLQPCDIDRTTDQEKLSRFATIMGWIATSHAKKHGVPQIKQINQIDENNDPLITFRIDNA